MSGGRHLISIWFFIGVTLLMYGVVIVGFGIYGMFSPPQREVILGHLHAELWWGAFLVVVGAFYTYHFRPGRD